MCVTKLGKGNVSNTKKRICLDHDILIKMSTMTPIKIVSNMPSCTEITGKLLFYAMAEHGQTVDSVGSIASILLHDKIFSMR